MALEDNALGFTLFLGLLSALPPLAIDMALPSLPTIQAEFAASPAETAAVIAIFIAGFSTAPIAVGPLADRYGRKPVMLAGIGIFTLCALGCALAASIGALLAFRLLQGVGAGAVGILPRAIIRDLFEGRAGRLQLAGVSLVFSVAPLIAPTLGAGILAFGTWRTIFFVLVAIGAVVALLASLWFRESHPRAKRRSLRPSVVIAGYRRALTHPMCLGFSVIGGTAFAGLFAYVNTSPLLFMQGYGLSKAGFAGLFAITASGVIVGSTINTWLLNRHARPRTVLDVTLSLLLCVALALVAVSLARPDSPFVGGGAGDGLYLDLRPRLPERGARGDPPAARDRRRGVGGGAVDPDAVRRGGRGRRRGALSRRIAAVDRHRDERWRSRGPSPLRTLAAAKGRGVTPP